MKKLIIPHNFTPRGYQIKRYNCLSQGFKRGVAVWHRRAGKDKVDLNIVAKESVKRVGTYLYILPYYKQARIVVWEGVDSSGFRLIEHFPREIIKRKENQQMVLELINGSFVRFVGSDNIDSIVGSNPIGVIFSEISLHKPSAWNYLRPILIENGGWALFNGTPRGKNLLWQLAQYAKKSPDWFYQLLTIEDTYRDDGKTCIVTEADIDLERQSGMPEELIQQEYFCSFEAGLVGSILGDLMAHAHDEGRISNSIMWNPELPVSTAWDLGYDDTNVIWFAQFLHDEIRLIDVYSNNRKPAGHYVNILNGKPYTYEEHFMPHDVEHHSYSTGNTRRETFENLGLRNITNIPKMSVADKYDLSESHHVMRQILPRCWFNASTCDDGIEGLKSYRREWDEVKQTFGANPVKDWAKHYADGFKTLAKGVSMRIDGIVDTPLVADHLYNELDNMEDWDSYNPLDDYLS